MNFDKSFYFSELKLEIEKCELDPYLDHFEEGVKDEVVMLGQISLEEVQEEEKRLRDEHIELVVLVFIKSIGFIKVIPLECFTFENSDSPQSYED